MHQKSRTHGRQTTNRPRPHGLSTPIPHPPPQTFMQMRAHPFTLPPPERATYPHEKPIHNRQNPTRPTNLLDFTPTYINITPTTTNNPLFPAENPPFPATLSRRFRPVTGGNTQNIPPLGANSTSSRHHPSFVAPRRFTLCEGLCIINRIASNVESIPCAHYP